MPCTYLEFLLDLKLTHFYTFFIFYFFFSLIEISLNSSLNSSSSGRLFICIWHHPMDTIGITGVSYLNTHAHCILYHTHVGHQ